MGIFFRPSQRSVASPLIRILAGALLSGAVCANAFAALPWVPLGTEAQRIEFMAASHRAIPRVLNTQPIFDIPLEELLTGQHDVSQHVRSEPAYSSLLDQRAPSLRASIDVSGAQVESSKLSPTALANWRHGISSALEEATGGGSRFPSTRGELAQLIDKSLRGARTFAAREVALAELRVLALHDHNGDSDPDLRGLRDWIFHLGEGDVDLFREAETIRNGLEGIEAALPARAVDKILLAIASHIKEIQAQVVPVVSTFTGRMTIEDVPPDLATMRGFFGDDCATKYSAVYADSPLERTFFIYDEHGAALAYAAATHVYFHGEPALYFHTVNGANISSAQVDEVLRAIYQLRERLGAKHIILPVPHRIDENMNYQPIKSAYHAASAGGYEGDVHYRDSGVRWILNETTDAHYDRESANNRGIEYSPKPRARADAHATVVESDYHAARALDAYEPVGALDILMLAYGLEQSGRMDDSFRVRRLFKIPTEQYKGLRSLISNSEGLSTENYNAAVRAFVHSIDGSAPGRDGVRDYAMYFSRGALLASDALDSVHRGATVNGVLGLILSGEARAAAKAVSPHPEAFESSADFRALLANLPISDAIPLWRAGVSPTLFPAQIAELETRLLSPSRREVEESARELVVMAPRDPAITSSLLSALQLSPHPVPRVRIALALLRTPLSPEAATSAAEAFAGSLEDGKLGIREILAGTEAITAPVNKGAMKKLIRIMRAIVRQSEDPSEVERARVQLALWNGALCQADLKTTRR